ncbi:urease accessory protein UreE [Pseudooceanicola sp. C21-150M6]|uniref:urease accessory protein UreE n=1 Tax=Pseudooceanicola sp. C21-150M6 TaxID=3434355 RepID=UPI003D7FF432
MTDLPAAYSVLFAADRTGETPAETITLDYEARFLRRKVLTSDAGRPFLVDLSETVSLEEGDCFRIGDNASELVEVRAAPEALLEIHTSDPVRIAWHVGNRHTPCQLSKGRLLIRADAVMEDMLHRLGAHCHAVTEPFRPEGGAYGMGRTHGHDHSHVHTHIGHSHGPDDEDHDHEHLHDH